MSAFDRPIGSAADVNELEYISYLHQTSPDGARKDCSITANDVQAYLMSRYGIVVDIEVVRGSILQGLGGGSSANDVIDLMELAAIIIIPILLKSAAAIKDKETARSRSLLHGTPDEAIERSLHKSTVKTDDAETESFTGSLWKKITSMFQRSDEKIYGDAPVAELDADILGRDPTLPNGVLLPPEDLFGFMSKIILHDITGDSRPKTLTKDFIKEILKMYGEHDIAENDDLVDEMFRCATRVVANNDTDPESNDGNVQNGQTMFDGITLSRVATFDVEKYDLSNENKMTTLYDDVFPPQLTLRGKANPYNVTQGDEFDRNNNEFGTDLYTTRTPVKRMFVAPSIDITAGTYRSKSLIVILWTSAILYFCTYYLTAKNTVVEKDYCANHGFGYNQTVVPGISMWSENSAAFACGIGISVVTWLVLFLEVGAFGLAFTSLGSIGNTVDCREFWHPLVGCLPVLVLSVVMYSVNSNSSWLTIINVSAIILNLVVVYLHVTHALSVLVSEEYLLEHQEIQEKWLSESTITWLRRGLKPRMIEAELFAKKAMAYKLNIMVENALLLVRQYDRDNVIDTYYGRAIQAFAKQGVRSTENVGGTFWTYRQIWNKHIFDREGVIYSVRVLASNIAQGIVVIFVLWAGTKFMNVVKTNFDSKDQVEVFANNLIQQQLQTQQANWMTANVSSAFGTYMYNIQASKTLGVDCSNYNNFNSTYVYSTCRTDTVTGLTQCQNSSQLTQLQATQLESFCALSTTPNLTEQQQISLLNESGFDVDKVSSLSQLAIQSAVDQSVESMYPSEQYMVTAPVYVAIFVAFCSSMLLTATYLANVTSTILQLRCGNLESLRNVDHQLYRAAPDSVALLTGSVFWGCLVSSILSGLFWGVIVFLFVWQATVYYAQRFVAIVIGILTITILKLLCLLLFRSKSYAGFYRKNPKIANIGILALEWANFTLSAGVIFVRLMKLVVVAIFSVGRVYRPFLAKGLGRIGPIELDGIPTIHLRELLAHEAHRHPYIELLGYMYLMKLRYTDEFGKTAGTCWRLVCLHALMPWLAKYRIQARRLDALNYDPMNPLTFQFQSIRRINTDTSPKHSETSVSTEPRHSLSPDTPVSTEPRQPVSPDTLRVSTEPRHSVSPHTPLVASEQNRKQSIATDKHSDIDC